MAELSRRELLALTAAAAGSSFEPAIAENARSGDSDWQLTYAKFDSNQRLRSPFLEGYCDRTSVRVGETVRFFLSTNEPSKCRIDVYRMGYHGGDGGCRMRTFDNLSVEPQPVPDRGVMRLRECRWAPAVEFHIPSSWRSGVYLGKLSCDRHRYQSYLIFIVADDCKCDFLFQCSTNTWQAYNKWPDASSLYDNDRPDRKPLASGVRASFDRPYAKYWQVVDSPLSLGSGEFLLFEFPFAYWLEQQGYDVHYCSNEDVSVGGIDFLKRAKAFLSVGHDEYWTRRQYDACLQAVQAGVNLGFFCGNSCCFVIDDSPAWDDRPRRTIERVGRYGGIRPGEEKYMADLPQSAPSEALLLGAQTMSPFNGSGDWVVTMPDHWIFAGTRMKKGDRIPGLVGWEHHGSPAAIPGLEVVAEGRTWTGGDEPSSYAATIYPGPKGNTVFNAATIFWAQGLASPPGHQLPFVHNGRPHGPDERVQRITKNLCDRWRSSRPPTRRMSESAGAFRWPPTSPRKPGSTLAWRLWIRRFVGRTGRCWITF
jgi:hypothetical protein